MRIYYRGPDVVVTASVFRDRSAAMPYAIRDLRDVHISRTQQTQPPAALVAVGILIIVTAGWPLWRASAAYTLGLVGLGITTLVAVTLSWRQRPRAHHLRATYRGTTVTLYSSPDERVFNQVMRALRRAIEDAHPPAAWADSAAV